MRRLLFFALMIAVFGLSSCGQAPASTAIVCTVTTATTASTSSSSSCEDPVTGITITVSPVTISLNVVTSTQFTGTVQGGTNNVITWQVNGMLGGNDTVGRIDSNGVYRAPAMVPSPANVNVTAVSFEDPALSATVVATILPPPMVTISPILLTLTSGTANTKAFMSTVTGAPTTNVNWYVAPVGGDPILGGNSTVGTINANGLYTAPLTPPIGNKVTVTVASNDYPLATASAAVTISGYSPSSFQGQFAFSASGTNASGTFFRAGSFSADGGGNLNGGLEDINDASGVTAIPISFNGTYTIGSDGRGTLQFNDGRTPANFDFVLVNSNQLQIIGFDATGTATGQANLQIASTFGISGLSGTYVFDFEGLDSGSKFLSQIGEFNADGAGNVKNGLVDVNDAGAISPALATFYTGSYQADPGVPNTLHTNGRMIATFHFPSGDRNFALYIVSRGSAKFVETDPRTTLGAVTGATSQQAANQTFNPFSLDGNFGFLLAGSAPGGPIATAGNFAADGNGHLPTGILDENINGAANPGVGFSNGSYTVATTGRGTATFTTANRTYTFVFYLGATGNAVAQETDSGIASDGIFAQQQSGAFSSASIQGNYAISTSGFSGSSAQVITGQLGASGAGVVVSGAIDINTAGTLTQGEGVAGTYSAPASNGRATLTLNPSTDNRNFAVYVVNSTQVLVIGINAGRLAAGQLLRQF